MTKFALPFIVFAAISGSLAAQTPVPVPSPTDVMVRAPGNMTLEREKEWFKLRAENEKARKQIADRERRLARERRNITSQQRRVASAQMRLSREELRLQKSESALSTETANYEAALQSLANVQERMTAMGGVRTIRANRPR